MADPIRLNAPVSLNGAAALAPTDAPLSGPTIASPTSVTLDGRDRSRRNVTSAPVGGGVGLAAPKMTKPAMAVKPKTITIEQTPDAPKTIGITADAAAPFVDEAQRVMKNVVGIGFGRQPHTFQATQVFRDNIGMTHVRMQRVYMGLPVIGDQIVTHFDKTGQVRDITNKDTPAGLGGLSIDPKVSPEQAMATAQAQMGVATSGESAPQLVVLKQPNGTYALAYHIVLESFANPRDPQCNHYFVDANSNKLIMSYNEIHGFVDGPRVMQRNGGFVPGPLDAPSKSRVPSKADAPDATPPAANSDTPAPAPSSAGSAPVTKGQPAPDGSGNSLYLGKVPLNTIKRPDGQYGLVDPSVRDAEVRDVHNTDSTDLGSDGFPVGATQFTDDNNVWCEPTDDKRSCAAVDAQFHAVKYNAYLKEVFGRDGIDGQGQQPRAVVHEGDQMVNAFYYSKVMWYGDGDGVTAGPLVDKDVASHEPTHGLTEASSNLMYWGESGAINEAMSDILGSAGYSWWLRGRKDTGITTDFWIGEDAWLAGDALRYMDHPTKDREGDSIAYSRDNYSDRFVGWGDNGGVHLNSGIVNNAFYLMCKGGMNDTSKITVAEGMGIADALQIFYRANTVYLTPSSDFASAREATIKSAVDLFGADSTQAKIVEQAWHAVGVEAAVAQTPSESTPSAPATLRRKAA